MIRLATETMGPACRRCENAYPAWFEKPAIGIQDVAANAACGGSEYEMSFAIPFENGTG